VWAIKSEITSVVDGRLVVVNLPIKCMGVELGMNKLTATAMMPNLREATIRREDYLIKLRSYNSLTKPEEQEFGLDYSPKLMMDYEPAAKVAVLQPKTINEIRVGVGQLRFTTPDGDRVRVITRWGQAEAIIGPDWTLETNDGLVEMSVRMVQRTNGASHGQE